MSVDDRQNAGAGDSPRPLRSEQAVIRQTGDAGVVATHGGDTSLGTTPIGLGSVGPVQQHQRATEMIQGQTDAAGGAATATGTGGKTQGRLSGILAKITTLPIAAIALGLVIAAIIVAAFVLRRRQ